MNPNDSHVMLPRYHHPTDDNNRRYGAHRLDSDASGVFSVTIVHLSKSLPGGRSSRLALRP